MGASSASGRIYRHQARGRFPLPTTEKWGEGQGEGISKEQDNPMERAPSPALSPLVPRRERGHFSDGGCIKMRPPQASIRENSCNSSPFMSNLRRIKPTKENAMMATQ